MIPQRPPFALIPVEILHFVRLKAPVEMPAWPFLQVDFADNLKGNSMTKVSKIAQLKSLWGFFKSTMSYGFSKASSEEIHYRKYQCLTCPNIRVGVSKSTAYLSLAKRVLSFFSKADFSSGKKIACGICGCKVSWRIAPAASYCPDKANPRWFAEKRDFFFSRWLRNILYKKDKQIAKP